MIRDGVRLVDGTYFSWNGLTIGVSVVGCFFLAAVNDVTSVRQETRRCLTTIDPSETETYKESTEKKHKKNPPYNAHMQIRRLNASILTRRQQFGMNQLFNGQYDTVFTPDSNGRSESMKKRG